MPRRAGANSPRGFRGSPYALVYRSIPVESSHLACVLRERVFCPHKHRWRASRFCTVCTPRAYNSTDQLRYNGHLHCGPPSLDQSIPRCDSEAAEADVPTSHLRLVRILGYYRAETGGGASDPLVGAMLASALSSASSVIRWTNLIGPQAYGYHRVDT